MRSAWAAQPIRSAPCTVRTGRAARGIRRARRPATRAATATSSTKIGTAGSATISASTPAQPASTRAIASRSATTPTTSPARPVPAARATVPRVRSAAVAATTAETCIALPLAPPSPVATGGSSICITQRSRDDLTGTTNVVTGEHSLAQRTRVNIYLGDTLSVPCPVCGGVCDEGPFEGDACLGTCEASGAPCRFATDCPSGEACTSTSSDCPEGACDLSLLCHGGANDGAPCRVEGETIHGAVSNDCPPAVGKNITGNGLVVDYVPLTSESRSLPSTVPCTAPGYELYDCPCPDDGGSRTAAQRLHPRLRRRRRARSKAARPATTTAVASRPALPASTSGARATMTTTARAAAARRIPPIASAIRTSTASLAPPTTTVASEAASTPAPLVAASRSARLRSPIRKKASAQRAPPCTTAAARADGFRTCDAGQVAASCSAVCELEPRALRRAERLPPGRGLHRPL